MLLLSVSLDYLLPQQDPLKQRQALSYLQGGQPLGRNDKPCKSFGFCNKISVAEIYEVRSM